MRELSPLNFSYLYRDNSHKKHKTRRAVGFHDVSATADLASIPRTEFIPQLVLHLRKRTKDFMAIFFYIFMKCSVLFFPGMISKSGTFVHYL